MRKSVTLSIPEELLATLDDYCKSHYMSRSQALCSSFVTVLNQQLAISNMAELSKIIMSFNERGNLTDEDKRIIAKFEAVSSSLDTLKNQVLSENDKL